MKKPLSLILALMICATNAYALKGSEYVKFKINGKSYLAPVPNKDVKNDFFYLRRALAGDKLAREFLLGEKEEKFIFIGDVAVNRWVRLTQNDVKVIEYNIGDKYGAAQRY